MKYVLFLLMFIAIGCKQKQPNILFILVDDLGYADVGFVGTKAGINTPNIDSLRTQSMLFPNAYTSNPVCSPTRASLMTGKYPSTLKLTCHIPAIGMEKYIALRSKGKPLMEADFIDRLPLEEVTIGEVLQTGGYTTGYFGKWHLAGEGSLSVPGGNVDTAFHPNHQGFDVSIAANAYGQPAKYFSPYDNGTITDGPKGEYLTERLTDEAINYMRNSKNKPFFCMLAYYSIHTPYQVSKAYLDKNKGSKYNAMVNAMDDNVGRVMAFLKEEGYEDNTVVIFYSDNGGVYSNKPLNGKKGGLYEGGIRVPMMVKYPHVIPANTENKTPIITNDFFPTIMDVAGIPINDYKETLEGRSFYSLLNEDNETLPERALYWHFPHHRKNTPMSMAGAIHEGDWKLIYEFESKEKTLFNLKSDPYEKYNLSHTNKTKTKELFDKLQAWQKETDVVMPQTNPDY